MHSLVNKYFFDSSLRIKNIVTLLVFNLKHLIQNYCFLTYSHNNYCYRVDTYFKLDNRSLVLLRHNSQKVMDLKATENLCSFIFLHTQLSQSTGVIISATPCLLRCLVINNQRKQAWFHIVLLGLRWSLRVAYGRWFFESFWVAVRFQFGSFCFVDVKAEFLNFGAKFIRTMGRKRSYRIAAVFPYDFLGHLRSFGGLFPSSELICIPTTQSFWVVCSCLF